MFLSKFRSTEAKLTILVVSTLITLLVCYYYNRYFIYGGYFHALRLVLYFAIPFIVNQFVLKFSWKDMGIRLPKFDRFLFIVLFITCVLLPMGMSLIFLSDDYLGYYERYRTDAVNPMLRLQAFLIFQFSTLITWEFMLRGVMLFGLMNLLKKEFRAKSHLLVVLPILWVTTSEVLYHLLKPDLEAFGMIIASPLLSWIAIRTKSLWVPLFVHIYIETVFILFLIYF